MVKIVRTNIPSSKGNLAAVVHYPYQHTERLAILCPGHLDSKDYTHLVRLAETLSAQGYTAVRFDPTGTWESDGSLADYTIEQQLRDVRCVRDALVAEGAYTYILLGGHSRGGLISILYAAHDPSISMVVGIMAPYALRRTVNEEKIAQWQKDGFRLSSRDVPGQNTTRVFRVPYSSLQEVERYNALDVVGSLRIPIVLVAGENDDVVLPEDVQRMFDDAHEPKAYMLIEGVGHDYRQSDREVAVVNERIMDQLKAFDGRR